MQIVKEQLFLLKPIKQQKNLGEMVMPKPPVSMPMPTIRIQNFMNSPEV
jgi:hypothetical protein